jgi:putative transposase
MGAVHSHIGETVVLCKTHQRCREIAALLHALLEQPPEEIVYGAWDNANTQEDAEVEAVVRSAAGRLVLLYLPTYSPGLNPIEMLWRHFRREGTHCALFESVKALVAAAQDFFAHYNRCPERILSIIGAIPKHLSVCTWGAASKVHSGSRTA